MVDGVSSLVRFGHALRAEGITVGPEQIRVYCDAAAALPPGELYWAGRAALLSSPEETPIYDEVFSRFFGTLRPGPSEEPEQEEAQATRATVQGADVGEELLIGAREGSASRADQLCEKSFADCTEAELSELSTLFAELPRVLPRRRSRRYRRGRPGRLDVRTTVRRAASTGGEPIHLHERRRRLQRRPLIFLLDVSGSMEAYSRGLLLFAYAAAGTDNNVDVYAFGTRLSHLGSALRAPTFERALRAAEEAVPDWDGGTRIGDAIAGLLERRGRRADTRRAAVVICSDGLETGDVDFLGEQIRKLRRGVSRIAWLNPLKEDPRYEPLARGMRASLPYVDVFESGHNLGSVLDAVGRLDSKPLAHAYKMLYTAAGHQGGEI